MLYNIYLAHIFGWWTLMLLVGLFRAISHKRLLLANWPIGFSALVYAIPSTGFHYFLLQINK